VSDVSGVTHKAEVRRLVRDVSGEEVLGALASAGDVSGVACEGMELSSMTSSPSCDFDNNIAASATPLSAQNRSRNHWSTHETPGMQIQSMAP